MSNVVDFSKFIQENGPDLDFRSKLMKLSYDDLLMEIIDFRDAQELQVLDEKMIKKGLALFEVAFKVAKTGFLKEFSETYLNHLKQEMKVLKKTYR